MKRLFTVLAVLMLSLPFAKAQQINLGPSTPIQVKGVLGTLYGGTGTVPSCHGANQALQYNDSVMPHVYQCVTISAGTGTVTSVSTSGTNGMFSVAVSTPSPNPNFTFTLSDALNQIFVGTGAGTGAWKTVPSCSGGSSALTFDNSTQTFGCNTTSGGGTTTNALTFSTSTNSGIGTFNGSAAVTIDYASIGAPSATGTGASGTWPISLANSVTFTSSGGAGPGSTYNGNTVAVDYHTLGAAALGGSNASGTWPISVTGTATALASAPSTCSVGQFATGIDISGNAICGASNVTLAMPTGSISGNTCTSPQTQALTGVTTTSTYTIGYASNPSAVTGWGANGGLVLNLWYASSGNFDWDVCNQTSSSITAGAISINVGVK